MSGNRRKTNRRKSYKRRRLDFRRVVVTSVCAVAVCALVVCVIVFAADRILSNRDDDRTGEKMQGSGMQDAQEETPDLEPDNASFTDEQETDKASASGEESLPEEEQEPGEAGTTLSIMGDSISTFQDYIPEGYYDFFPENGYVSEVDDTWWKRVLDEKGWTLCVNASSSGATCTGDSTGTDNPQCGCNEFRTDGLAGADGKAPDIIIVYMGTNDFLQSIPLGDNDGTRAVPEGQVSMFGDAYTLMLDKLMAKYPSSKIYCCTILQIGAYGTDTPFVEMVNGEGATAADYSARIAQIAENKNLPVIDLYTCGITVENLHNASADGVHPTADGMKYIAEAVGKVLD